MHGKPVSCSFVYIFPELSLTINCFHPSLFGGRVPWPQLSGSHGASNPELLGAPAGFRIIHLPPPFLLAPDATPGGDPQTAPRGLRTQAAAAVTEFSCPCSAPRQHVGFDKLSSGFFQPLPAFRDLTGPLPAFRDLTGSAAPGWTAPGLQAPHPCQPASRSRRADQEHRPGAGVPLTP